MGDLVSQAVRVCQANQYKLSAMFVCIAAYLRRLSEYIGHICESYRPRSSDESATASCLLATIPTVPLACGGNTWGMLLVSPLLMQAG